MDDWRYMKVFEIQSILLQYFHIEANLLIHKQFISYFVNQQVKYAWVPQSDAHLFMQNIFHMGNNQFVKIGTTWLRGQQSGIWPVIVYLHSLSLPHKLLTTVWTHYLSPNLEARLPQTIVPGIFSLSPVFCASNSCPSIIYPLFLQNYLKKFPFFLITKMSGTKILITCSQILSSK